MPLDLFIVAEVLRPHGIRGEIVLRPQTNHLETILNAPEFYLGQEGRGPIRVQGVRLHKGAPLLKLEGVDSMDDARALAGQPLCLPRHALRPLSDDEFFLHELVGLAVRDWEGHLVGNVEWILETGGAPVLVGTRSDGREFMIPFASGTVLEVDLQKRALRLANLPGLLEEQE